MATSGSLVEFSPNGTAVIAYSHERFPFFLFVSFWYTAMDFKVFLILLSLTILTLYPLYIHISSFHCHFPVEETEAQRENEVPKESSRACDIKIEF